MAYRIFFAQLRGPSTINRNLHPEVFVQTYVNAPQFSLMDHYERARQPFGSI